MLELIEKCCLLPHMPFPRIVQPPQIGGITLGHDNGQGAPKPDDIRDHPGILVVRLQRRIVIDLLHLLRVHGVYLNNFDLFIRKIMHEGLSIRTSRFIANEHLITSKSVLTGYSHTPEFLESFFCVIEPEGLGASPVQGSAIPCVACYAYVHCRDQCSFLHLPYPLCPQPFHCSFLLVRGRNKQLPKRRIPIFLFPLNHKLQYSKL